MRYLNVIIQIFSAGGGGWNQNTGFGGGNQGGGGGFPSNQGGGGGGGNWGNDNFGCNYQQGTIMLFGLVDILREALFKAT